MAGCFFWIQNRSFGVKASAKRETNSFKVLAFECHSANSSRSAGRNNTKGVNNTGSGNSVKRSVEKQNVLSINNNFCLNSQNKSPEVTEIEKELYAMVQDYPIKEMVPYIAEYDREVAALIIGIANKESNWGKRSPSKNGKTCYNYWGYKGAGSRGLAMGYGCFASPQEGVEVIGKRIQELADKNINTPRKMVIWKCGRSCRGHNPAGVRKWISDVNIYFKKIAVL